MIGVFGLKKNAPVSALSVPPLVFTVIFKIVIMMYFERVSKHMEMDEDGETPRNEQKSEELASEIEEVDEDFLQVILCP